MNDIDLRTDDYLAWDLDLYRADGSSAGTVQIWHGHGRIELLGLWADGREWISIGVPDTPPPGSTPPDESTIVD